MKKVFCFGVFDGIHDGHREMLKEARSLGDYLIVALTQDHVVEQLKKKRSRNTLAERIKSLAETGLADEVVAGDQAIQSWQVLQSYQPDIIALGYDQLRLLDALGQAIRNFSFSLQIVVLKPHKPEELHSSLLFPSKD
ncbi:MAG: adenylyltransferase/cytidyltransferase family protein [Candidatus Abawacabacteria bacterium]|nr:adenylyltransferase/cytidyltransferase family protein [Candidatus Abawacabacteria bacterium]